VEVSCDTVGGNKAQGDDRELDYSVKFRVRELRSFSPSSAATLSIGNPQGRDATGEVYVTSRTPLTFAANGVIGSQDLLGVQYRLRRVATPLPLFPSAFPFQLHWTHTGFIQSGTFSPLFLTVPDGRYVAQ